MRGGLTHAGRATAPTGPEARSQAGLDDVDRWSVPQRWQPLAGLAERLYDPALPYHHFGHAMRAARHGERLADAYQRAGIPVRADLVQAALLYHDAGYNLSPRAHGCQTREQVAAQLAESDLARLGWSTPDRLTVTRAILATEHSTRPLTAEERIVRAADLAELAAPYRVFLSDSSNVRAEATLLGQPELTDQQWAERTATLLGSYLAEALHPSGISRELDEIAETFQRQGRQNLVRYVQRVTTHTPH